MSAGPDLGIVVVNYGSSRLLVPNLAGLDGNAVPGSTLVVVDNWSTAAERAEVVGLADERGWELVGTAANLGFGAAANRGAAAALAAGCRWLMFLNPDVRIEAGAVAALLRAAGERPGTMVAPALSRPDGSPWASQPLVDRRTGLTRSWPDGDGGGAERFLTAACLLVDRDAWAELGGFDERYFLYWEDVDLSHRFVRAGGGLAVVADAPAVHQVGGTQRASGKSARYCYFMCRNRLLFAGARLPARARARWLAHAPRYAARVARRDGPVAPLRRPSLALAAAAGTAVGMARVLGSLARGRT